MRAIIISCAALLLILSLSGTAVADPNLAIIVDHNCVDITAIPQAAIEQAKTSLHIAYGHTSHGSQVTDGMTGLVGFANGGGKGLSLPTDIFQWNYGGTGGALDLREGDGYGSGDMDHDCGYYPNWVNETTEYLGVPNGEGRGSNHPEINVIIWSWCGQITGKYQAGTLYSEYLTPMSQLEVNYPGVVFVYMTGHLDHGSDAANKAANQTVRDYCIANNKVLYDFADIESWDPNGTYFEFADDGCYYYASASGPQLGNWAIEWQDSHTVNVDWYSCSAAHTQPLNGNQKAYAAWWLWAWLGGWNGCTQEIDGDINSDCKVNFIDFALLAQNWMTNNTTGDIAPPGGNGIVDVNDLGLLSENWLTIYP